MTAIAYDGSTRLGALERAEVDHLVHVIEDAPPGSYVDLAMHILRSGYQPPEPEPTEEMSR